MAWGKTMPPVTHGAISDRQEAWGWREDGSGPLDPRRVCMQSLNWEQFSPQGTCDNVERHFDCPGWWVLLASSGQGPGMRLNILQ